MAQIVLKIKANDGADVLATFTADKIVNNVSTLIGQETTKNSGVNGKTFATGFLSLYDGFLGGKDTKLQSEVEKYNGFMFGATDETGSYSLKLTLTGNNLDKIVIIGDMEANQYPVRAILDEGTEYEKVVYSNDLNWAIAFDNENATHTIHFIKWNRANYNACFTTLQVLVEYLEFDRSAIDSVDSLTQSTSDPSSIQYGILANSGSVSIRDLDGELKEYVEDGIIENSNVPVDIYVNGKMAQTHTTTNGSTYYENSKILNLEMQNDVNDYNSEIYGVSLLNTSTSTLYQVLTTVLYSLGYSQLTSLESQGVILDEFIYPTTDSNEIMSIKQYLQKIIVPYKFLYKQTGISALNKICEVAQLNCFKDKNNNLKFISARPYYYYSSSFIIDIKPYQITQSNSGTFDLFAKNKYGETKRLETHHSFSLMPVINQRWKITNENQELDPSEVSSNATIYESNEVKYLQFFYDFSGQNNNISNFIYSGTSPYVAEYTFETNTTSNITRDSQIQLLNKTKNDVNFIELGSHAYKLAKETGINNTSFAIKKRISEDVINSLSGTNDAIYFSLKIYAYNLNIQNGNEIIEKNSNIKGLTYEFNSSNELLFEEVYFNEDNGSRNQLANISANILNDYSNGIKTLELEIFYVDMYNIYGEKIKDAKNGDIIEIGDVIRISNYDGVSNYKKKNGDDIYWKVVGVKLIYSASIKMLLTLQEIIN